MNLAVQESIRQRSKQATATATRPGGAASPGVSSASDHEREPEESRRVRALLVDDEPRLLRAYARLLRPAGIDCELALSGAEADIRLAASEFDVVVSDILMPSMDGVELLRRVRERDLDVPVILMTGSPSVESAAKAVEYGALRYLLKPVDTHELVDAIAEAGRLCKLAKLKRRALEHAGRGDAGWSDRSALEVCFARALDSLWMAYQPIVSWKERRVVAYEALCRTREPGFPHPGALIDAAERLGRIHDLGRRIRKRAVSAMPELGNDTLLFINLHPQDLADETLAAGSPHASRIVLEVTERTGLNGVADAEARIDMLKTAGYRIAVDDLGAGYAGLSTFVKLAPHVVKLDMSLVRDIDKEPRKAQIIGGMVELCIELGTRVVVEGVETEAERDTLSACGCDWMQGYLFGRPAADIIVPDLAS